MVPLPPKSEPVKADPEDMKSACPLWMGSVRVSGGRRVSCVQIVMTDLAKYAPDGCYESPAGTGYQHVTTFPPPALRRTSSDPLIIAAPYLIMLKPITSGTSLSGMPIPLPSRSGEGAAHTV